jgi:transcriptional regulator with XRE-family HTH domain
MAAAGRRDGRKRKKEILLQLLREVRREAGLRQVDLANRLGQPQSFVSKYESGERRMDLIDVHEVCEALDVSLADFVKRFQRLVSAIESAGPAIRAKRSGKHPRNPPT